MRHRLPSAFVSMIVVICLVAPGSAAFARGRYAIGDSVMLGAAPQLRARGIKVDATVSRQFDDALRIVRRSKREGTLRRTTIVHLGTNGVPVTSADCDALARAVGGARRLFLVTIKIPRSYRDAQNTRLAQCADRHANTRLIDWYRFSRDHDAWFYADGYHLTPTGRVRYATLIDRATD